LTKIIEFYLRVGNESANVWANGMPFTIIKLKFKLRACFCGGGHGHAIHDNEVFKSHFGVHKNSV
jgi:hypothetical protein